MFNFHTFTEFPILLLLLISNFTLFGEDILGNILIYEQPTKYIVASEKYKDEYHIKLKKAIKQKINGKEIVEAKEDRAPTKIINLMEALQKSLDVNNGKKKAE